MYKISIRGIQLSTGYTSEIEFLSPTECLDFTLVALWDTSNYEPDAAEVEEMDDN